VFKVGDRIVYPQHGAGVIDGIEKRTVLGEEVEYLTIRILSDDLVVRIPVNRVDELGLRRVMDQKGANAILAVLAEDVTEDTGSWSRRFRMNKDKIRSGDVREIAEVIREAADDSCNVIFGATVDENLGDQVWVTVIATGFDRPAGSRPLEASMTGGASMIPEFNVSASEPDKGDGGLDVPDFLK